jgi:hypothetical protein
VKGPPGHSGHGAHWEVNAALSSKAARRLARSEEALLNKIRRFGARSSTAGWAPYVMISAGLGAGALLLAIALFLKLS